MKSCEVDLKTPPAATYLQPVPQEKRVPSGQYAKYECIDSELGVERGESKYYNILCMGHGEYDYPPAPEYWPVCRSKTTTFAPGKELNHSQFPLSSF